MMKKLIFCAFASILMTSCVTTVKTARVESVPYSMYNATVADLEVSEERITYNFVPSKDIQRAGMVNCKTAAINEALTSNGNADLLLDPQFVICAKRGLFGKKITNITVTGRPAKYKNFRSMDDKVWTDPVFRKSKGTSYHVFEKVSKK